jgi:hypothetical protein
MVLGMGYAVRRARIVAGNFDKLPQAGYQKERAKEVSDLRVLPMPSRPQ